MGRTPYSRRRKYTQLCFQTAPVVMGMTRPVSVYSEKSEACVCPTAERSYFLVGLTRTSMKMKSKNSGRLFSTASLDQNRDFESS